ncbi:transporter substrate-binding domain-containing protein [Shewanella olleyana]|uniref:substrate-binding periplasmic protein n=1 Tax=Shewanella olleyana TaxID=135626 RepID=UPI00200D6A86|nr:transporter substrate-binding domain-containing protein [Shewanella olleyana]MCL1065253.1 transporter substrate-binding domain-containing protein [Shewanella olleyana]
MKYIEHSNNKPTVFSVFVLFTLILSSDIVLASEKKSIHFTTSNSIEPYFFVNKKSGLQYELLDAALSASNLQLGGITFATNLRALRLVKTKKIDCIINSPSNSDGLFLTQSLIEYQNSVFFLTKNKLKIDTIQDLKNYSLVGFQNANHYLGAEFSELSITHKSYHEIASQKNQILMLFSERIQAIILEQRIFDYYRNQIDSRIKSPFEVTKVKLFDPAPRYIACHDPHTAMLVNEAISQLKQTNLYQDILLKAERSYSGVSELTK